MHLTSSVKELEAILQKLIKLTILLTWNKSRSKKWDKSRWIGVDGDADELLDEVVGSVQQRKRIEMFSQELENEKRKKAV